MARFKKDADIQSIQRHFRKYLRAATPWWPNPLPPIPPLPSLKKFRRLAASDQDAKEDEHDDQSHTREEKEEARRRKQQNMDDELDIAVAEVFESEDYPQYRELVSSLKGEFSKTMRDVDGSLWDITDAGEDETYNGSSRATPPPPPPPSRSTSPTRSTSLKLTHTPGARITLHYAPSTSRRIATHIKSNVSSPLKPIRRFRSRDLII